MSVKAKIEQVDTEGKDTTAQRESVSERGISNRLSCKQSTGDRDQSEAPLNVDQGISYLNEMRDASVKVV